MPPSTRMVIPAGIPSTRWALKEVFPSGRNLHGRFFDELQLCPVIRVELFLKERLFQRELSLFEEIVPRSIFPFGEL